MQLKPISAKGMNCKFPASFRRLVEKVTMAITLFQPHSVLVYKKMINQSQHKIRFIAFTICTLSQLATHTSG